MCTLKGELVDPGEPMGERVIVLRQISGEFVNSVRALLGAYSRVQGEALMLLKAR